MKSGPGDREEGIYDLEEVLSKATGKIDIVLKFSMGSLFQRHRRSGENSDTHDVLKRKLLSGTVQRTGKLLGQCYVLEVRG